MNIEIRSVDQRVVNQVIFVNGAEVGEIKMDPAAGESWRYHAAIKIGSHTRAPSYGLAQGFGPDPDTAIRAAFADTRIANRLFMEDLERMERLVMGAEGLE